MPNPANPQAWDRFGYVQNNPINFNDPTGHEPKYGEGACYEIDCKNANGTLVIDGNGEGGAPKKSEKDEEIDNEYESTFFNILSAKNSRKNQHDAHFISLSLVQGFRNHFVYRGYDLVWTDEAVVLFRTRYRHMFNSLDVVGSQHINLTPQYGATALFGSIASNTIRNDPSTEGIIDAYSGLSISEGFSILFFSVNGFSSADSSTGDPNFTTVGSGGGISLGMPDIFLEAHTYPVIADRTWP